MYGEREPFLHLYNTISADSIRIKIGLEFHATIDKGGLYLNQYIFLLKMTQHFYVYLKFIFCGLPQARKEDPFFEI